MDLSNLGQGGGQQIKINVADQPNVKCEECESIYFNKVTVIKKLSKILVGTTDDQLVPMETYICAECGYVNKEFRLQ